MPMMMKTVQSTAVKTLFEVLKDLLVCMRVFCFPRPGVAPFCSNLLNPR